MSDIILVRVADRSMPILKKVGALQHPMNLVCLATWLREHGHNPEIVDLEVEPQDYLIERLKSAKPYLVGITAMTPNITEARHICTLSRSLGIKTVLGGAHPTVLPDRTLQDTGCDYVVIGEGEKPLCELLDNIKNNIPTDTIKGIVFLKEGCACINERPPLIELNQLPIPDRRFLKLDLYRGYSTPGISARAAVIFTSRGCAYDCTFCASKVINQRRVRFRDMGSVFKEIDDVVSLGFRHLTIDDDTFTLDSQRVKQFCSYLKSKYPRLSWDCDARVDTVDAGLIRIMKDSHCKKIAFGVESGSPRIIKSINKNIDINQVKRAFGLAKKFKILTQGDFVIGFPEEAPEDIKATEELIFEIKPDFLLLSVCVPYPGTAIYDYMLKNGYLTYKDWDSFVFFGKDIPWRTAYFNGDELVAMRKSISRKFYFRPSYIFKKILSLHSISEIRYLIKAGLAAFDAFLN